MKSKYKNIGEYIQQVDVRNHGLKVQKLVGLSITKEFIPSVANIVGTDMENYKIIRRNQFACSTMQVRRDKKMPVALFQEDEAIISQAYPVFEVKDEKKLLPEYLMMWFAREEFDREACFYAVGGVRGSLEWEDFESMKLPIPNLDTQKALVAEYNVIQERIKHNQQLILKLEEAANSIYSQSFLEFDFSDGNGKPYKSSGGEMIWSEELKKEIPSGWRVEDLGNVIEYKKGYAFKSEDYCDSGTSIIRVSDLGEKFVENSQFYKTKYNQVYDAYKVFYSDLIITTVGSWASNPLSVVGKLVRVPSFANGFYLNQNMVRIRPIKKIREIIYQQLIQKSFSEYLISGAQGSANQASITLDHIFKFKVLVPSEPEQNLLFEGIYNFIDRKFIENQKLQELKDLLLSKLAKVG